MFGIPIGELLNACVLIVVGAVLGYLISDMFYVRARGLNVLVGALAGPIIGLLVSPYFEVDWRVFNFATILIGILGAGLLVIVINVWAWR